MMLKSFFLNLSERLYDENSLSDITWAFAKANPDFMKIFMGLFHFDFNIDEPWNIYRESSENDSRPDFIIEQGDKRFIVENKIYDRNNHFEQYAKTFDKDKRGFIANYRVPMETERKYGFSRATWEDLIGIISREINNLDPLDEGTKMLQAYTEYVKEVCGIVEMKEMRLDKLVSLYHFNKLVEHIVRSSVEGYECELINQGKCFGESYSGRYFALSRTGDKIKVYPWLGIWYGETPPSIYMSFRKDWCPKFHKDYDINKRNEGNYFAPPYHNEDDYDALEFELKHDVLQEFSGASLDKQKTILSKFFAEIINEVGKYL